jgi:hypothetical protein
MTPDMAASEIKRRWEGITTELVRQKRIDPMVYDVVVSILSRQHATDSGEGNVSPESINPSQTIGSS